jgi:hypothetical protein
MRARLDQWFSAIQSAVDDWEGLINEVRLVVNRRRTSTACALCPQNINSPEDSLLVEVGDRDGMAHRFCAMTTKGVILQTVT